MTNGRPQVGLASNNHVREMYIGAPDLERLEQITDFHWREFNASSSWDDAPSATAEEEDNLVEFVRGLDALIVCHGSPLIGEQVFGASRRLTLVGELEGDRFARRIDVSAADARGVKVVDTTHGSSYPVAEWALGMMLIGLRNAGAYFRNLIAGGVPLSPEDRERDPGYLHGELTGKTVGLIGCGYIGRRLIEFLRPFHVSVLVHDPYVPKEVALACDFTLTSLENVMSVPDIVVCLAPITPATRGMLGRREFGLLKPGAVFVNVSRGAVVDTHAMLERLEGGDIIASLDVFDPEPIPLDSPVREMSNVFLTPHIAGVTARSRTRFFTEMVDELERHFAGHETRHDLGRRSLANRAGAEPPQR